jgi:hypothetical protein
LGPFRNYSELAYAKLVFTNIPTTLSFRFCDRITHELLADPGVCFADLKNLKAHQLHSRIDNWDPYNSSGPSGRLGSDGWMRSDITIEVPLGRAFTPRTMQFTAGQLTHQSLIQVISRRIRNDRFFTPTALIPYCHYVQRNGEKERIYDHPMCGDYIIDEYLKVQALPNEPGDGLERCIVGIQLWSDATKLANFGSHKLWPMYGCLAHTPTWARHSLNNDIWFDIGYIPQVCSEVYIFNILQY